MKEGNDTMGKVKYGTFVERTFICSKCNDCTCTVTRKMKVVISCQKPSDIEPPKWIKEGKCLNLSFNDAEWVVADSDKKGSD